MQGSCSWNRVPLLRFVQIRVSKVRPTTFAQRFAAVPENHPRSTVRKLRGAVGRSFGCLKLHGLCTARVHGSLTHQYSNEPQAQPFRYNVLTHEITYLSADKATE
jgi:hypothetical protein